MAKILSFPGSDNSGSGDSGSGNSGSDASQPTASESAGVGDVPTGDDVLSRDPQRKPPKFGFTRVRRTRSGAAIDQLDLFARGATPNQTPGQTPGSGTPEDNKLLVFPGATSSFEQALEDDESGNEAAARAGYLTAIDLDDCTSDAYCNLGILEYVGGNAEIAFDCFRQALKHDQRHWESHYNLGNLYFDNGQHDPSRVHYEVAAEIEPGFRNVHFNLALVLALEGEYGPAVEALERFRDLAPPEEAEAAEELLDTLRASKAHAEARRSPD